MNRLLVAAIKSPARGRQMIAVCLNCAQAAAPDWPLLILWPFLKLSFAKSLTRFSGTKNRRESASAHSGSARFLRVTRSIPQVSISSEEKLACI